MKINVNGYNEILSYEGTPEELAEFVATGILFPYMDEDEEECDCEEEQDESVIVPDAMDAEESVVETAKDADEILDDQKEKVREALAAEGYVCSDEEFEDAYKTAVKIMDPLKWLFR